MGIQVGNVVAEVQVAKLAIAGGASSANVFASLPNPWGVAMIITKAVLRVTTIATAAATLDIGVAADATTADDTLLDGVDVHSATGLFDNVTNKGTDGLPEVVLAATGYITVKEASGNVDGLVGTLYLQGFPAF